MLQVFHHRTIDCGWCSFFLFISENVGVGISNSFRSSMGMACDPIPNPALCSRIPMAFGMLLRCRLVSLVQ